MPATPLSISKPPSNRSARAALHGTWRMQEFVMAGTATRPTADVTWAVRGEELVIRHDGVVQRPLDGVGFALVASPGGRNGAVDYVVRYASGRVHTLPGVFEVDGDTLTLSVPTLGERTADCTPGPDCIVYTFTRVPDAEL